MFGRRDEVNFALALTRLSVDPLTKLLCTSNFSFNCTHLLHGLSALAMIGPS